MQALCVNWSNLKLPWVDLDWLIDISCQITELDLSANCLVSLPSVIPWGLINLRKLSLADNQLTELPSVQSSDEIICTRCVHHTRLSLQGEQAQTSPWAWGRLCKGRAHCRSCLFCFLSAARFNLRFAPLHSQCFQVCCQDSRGDFYSCMLPLLFSSSDEPHSSKLAQSDIYWLIPMIWSALYPDHLSLLPGRVNFLIRVLCFALWGAFQLLSFRTKAILVKQMSVATGGFASVLLMPDWDFSVLTGYLRSTYPATGSPLSLLDSYILKTLKNSSLLKTIWRSYLTRKTVRTVQCLAYISRLSCREEPKKC